MNEMENNTPNEMIETEKMESVELKQEPQKPQENGSIKKKKNWFQIGFYSIITIAVIVLYVLHFLTPKPEVFVPKVFEGKPGSGEIVFINLDTINENYKLVDQLKKEIDAETKRQELIFQNKEQAFKQKYAQFEENYSKGVLTQIQIQNAQNLLQQEYTQLEAEKENVFNNLQTKQANALLQLYDSLQVVVKRINIQRNASFVLTYQSNSPFLIHADPSKEITNQVLFELNRSIKDKN
jgi:Skp family chaperone for outer membrane proteins